MVGFRLVRRVISLTAVVNGLRRLYEVRINATLPFAVRLVVQRLPLWLLMAAVV